MFSGGQDSTTLLGWALNRYQEVECIMFDYGQKHAVELQVAQGICEDLDINDWMITLPFMKTIADSALLNGGDVSAPHPMMKQLPASYVPNRNAMFLTIAHSLAIKIFATTVIFGANAEDYSGYPDCRQEFVDLMQTALWKSSDKPINIITPLMNLTKAEIFLMADREDFLEMVVNRSHTCYNGKRDTFWGWGYGCNDCPACKLRAKGYEDYLKLKKL